MRFAKMITLVAVEVLSIRSLSWVLIFVSHFFFYVTSVKSEDGGVTFNTSLNYTSGSYGSEEKTSIVYAPLSLELYRGPWSIRTVVPWLRVEGPALVLDGALSPGIIDRKSNTTSGVGDVSVSLMYSLEELYDEDWFVDFTTRFKLPTASYTKGLGSGELDTSFQLDVAKVFGDLMPFFMIGYKFSGSPDDIKFKNIVYNSLGIQYRWSDLTALGVVYDYRESSVKNSQDSQELLTYINFRLIRDWSFNLYVLAGLSSNSPSYGGGLSFSYKFKY
jgi:hypothetical protein